MTRSLDRREIIRASLKKRRARLLAEGICRDCGRVEREPSRTLCKLCLEARRGKMRQPPRQEPSERVERMMQLAMQLARGRRAA